MPVNRSPSQPWPVLGAGAAVGAFNAVLISGIGISPFLATLGTLFIGRSIQQLLTNGGNPVYLPPSGVPEAFRFLGRGAIAGIPVPLIIAAIIILGATVVLTRARFGRVALAIGIQASVVRYSGIAARAHVAVAFILAGLIAAVAGLILSATVTVYIPSSGSAFLLNAIGATTSSARPSRASAVPIFQAPCSACCCSAIVANGLLLTGLNFYWQQVGTGLLIFAVLALSFITRRKASS